MILLLLILLPSLGGLGTVVDDTLMSVCFGTRVAGEDSVWTHLELANLAMKVFPRFATVHQSGIHMSSSISSLVEWG